MPKCIITHDQLWDLTGAHSWSLFLILLHGGENQREMWKKPGPAPRAVNQFPTTCGVEQRNQNAVLLLKLLLHRVQLNFSISVSSPASQNRAVCVSPSLRDSRDYKFGFTLASLFLALFLFKDPLLTCFDMCVKCCALMNNVWFKKKKERQKNP